MAFFVGMTWHIVCEITFRSHEAFYRGNKTLTIEQVKSNKFVNSNNFWYEFEMYQKAGTDTFLICFYFAMTSLTTVGFGDFYPKADPERLICAAIFIFGTAIFAYI